jgi:hypothetical protein
MPYRWNAGWAAGLRSLTDATYQDAASENVVLGWPLDSRCHSWCLSPCRNNSSSPSWRYVSRCCCMTAAKLLYCFVGAACYWIVLCCRLVHRTLLLPSFSDSCSCHRLWCGNVLLQTVSTLCRTLASRTPEILSTGTSDQSWLQE